MKTYSQKEVDDIFPLQPDLALWTVIIPAAGSGSRLGYNKPKILYPIVGKTILDRLIDLLDPFCQHFIYVLSPQGENIVRPFITSRLPGRFEVVIQAEPGGMADAIWQAVPKVTTPYTLIIWGDQVAISPETLRAVMQIQQFSTNAKLTLPLVRRENPYVHYVVDDQQQFMRVLEKREGAQMPSLGNSDCGLFAFATKKLQEVFRDEIAKGITLSAVTKEWNFLPMLPQFETGTASVNAFTLTVSTETVGVNDTADAAVLEAYFKQREKA